MNPFVRRSRISKSIVDLHDMAFSDVERRLDAVHLTVAISAEQSRTPAGQAAALTALATGIKCFGHASLLVKMDSPLIRTAPFGETLVDAAISLGAVVTNDISTNTSHVVAIGEVADWGGSLVSCWWDGWCSGVVPKWDHRSLGMSGNPLAGVFAGALGVREVFADVRGDGRAGARESVVSLWAPWEDLVTSGSGPGAAYLPMKVWMIGLGHLGQGYLWSLAFLPVSGKLAILQDPQFVGEENVATGLVTTDGNIRDRKTRVAAKWLEKAGWQTALIERPFGQDFVARNDEPAMALTGLHDVDGRLAVARAGFEYMVDAGIGHGPIDFECAQIRVHRPGDALTWNAKVQTRSVDDLLERQAYKEQAAVDKCGAYELAEASVAVPFVGAAIGALTLAQAMRIASMCESIQLMQLELACPDMVTRGALLARPSRNIGGVRVEFVGSY